MTLNFYSELLPSHTVMCIEHETELLLLYLLVKWSHNRGGCPWGSPATHDTCMRIEVRLYTAKICFPNIGFVNTLCG